MNSGEFESRLQQTPLRPPPVEWREEILAVTRSSVAANVKQQSAPERELTFAATWQGRLRELFWPHPIAWGVIVATWIAIPILNAGSDTNGHRPTASAATLYVAWQTMLLHEGHWQDESYNRPAPKEPTRTNPQMAPRSQSVMKWRTI